MSSEKQEIHTRMGNCPPLPCPSPCPDLSFQGICANNNCHGCCIFHGCCNLPSVPDEAPAWDSPPPVQQLRQLPSLPAQRPGSVVAKGPATTARGIGGVAPQDVPAGYGYQFRPSPWGIESGLVPTGAAERDNGSGGVAPPGVPPAGNVVGRPAGPSPVPWLARSAFPETTAITGHDAGGVPTSNGDRRPLPSTWGSAESAGSGVSRDRGRPPVQPAQRGESGLAETWAAYGRDAGAWAPDVPPAAPQVVAGKGSGTPLPSLSSRRSGGPVLATGHGSGGVPVPVVPPPYRRTVSSSADTAMATTGRDDGLADVARADPGRRQPVVPSSVRRALSDVEETTRATGHRDDMPLAVAVESVKESSRRRRDSSLPAAPLPAWRSRDTQPLSPSPSLSAGGRLSPAESRSGTAAGFHTPVGHKT